MVDRKFWRGRWTHLLLLVGVALAASQLLKAMPKEQDLLFVLPNDSPVETLHATWSDVDGAELGGVTLHFPAGRKSRIHHHVDLANGEYEINVEVQYLQSATDTATARSKTNLKRRVTLRGGQTPIRLH